MKTILVCGTREASEEWRETVRAWKSNDTIRFVHGAALGIDSLCDAEARKLFLPADGYPADWDTHGKAAGPIRNRAMFVDAKPDLVLAFGPIIKSRGRDGVKLTGTGDMVSVAHEGGCQVILVPRPNVLPRG